MSAATHWLGPRFRSARLTGPDDDSFGERRISPGNGAMGDLAAVYRGRPSCVFWGTSALRVDDEGEHFTVVDRGASPPEPVPVCDVRDASTEHSGLMGCMSMGVSVFPWRCR